jgi:predicted Zn-dependent peptidase
VAFNGVKSFAWLVPCLALACHGGARSTTPKPPAPEREHTVRAGTRVVTLPRATPGVVRLSLYVDAGSRDASPPQAATVAAWLAAEHAGGPVEPLVYPDVTELSRNCEPATLERCVIELARALSFRAPTAAQLVAAQARLEDSRRRALAADPDRPADELAARSLLGAAAGGFFPLGRTEDDPQLTAESVDILLRDHYGPNRALLVAAGEIDADVLGELVSREFSKLVAAHAVRPQRTLELPDEPKLQAALDNRGSTSFALIGRDESELRAQVRTLSERLLDARVDGRVFAVRGAALALVRIAGDALQLLPRATRELVRLRLEPPPPAAPLAGDDDLASISRSVGLGFGTSSEPSDVHPPSSMHFGAGALIVGGMGAGPKVRETQQQLDAKLLDQAESLFQRALSIDDPRTSGARDEYATALATENGARIDVQLARGPYVAIAVRVALGAEQDPVGQHGRSALLATLTATACAGMGPELLHEELAQLEATLEPRVAAESYGLLMRAPVDRWQAALDLALRCARTPSRDGAHFVSAALRLQGKYSGETELGLRARLANQIAPRSPGMLAAWGDPGRIGNLTARDLGEAFRSSELGVRWSVAVVGAVPIEEASARIARRIADLPAGALPKAVEPGQLPAAAYVAPASESLESRLILATWDTRGVYPHRLGAAVFVSAMHALLALTPGIEVAWQDADVYPAGAYAALQLRVGPEALPRLATLLAESAARLSDAELEEAITRGVALAQKAQSASDAEASVRAEQLARTRLGARPPVITREQAKALALALRKAAARLTVMR